MKLLLLVVAIFIFIWVTLGGEPSKFFSIPCGLAFFAAAFLPFESAATWFGNRGPTAP